MNQIMTFTPDRQAPSVEARRLVTLLAHHEDLEMTAALRFLRHALTPATEVAWGVHVTYATTKELEAISGVCDRTIRRHLAELGELPTVTISSGQHGYKIILDASTYLEALHAPRTIPRTVGRTEPRTADNTDLGHYPGHYPGHDSVGTEDATCTGVTIPSKNTTYSSRVSESSAPTHTPAKEPSPCRLFALQLHGWIEQKYAEMGVRVDDLSDLSRPLLKTEGGAWEADTLLAHIKEELPAYRMRCRSTKSALSALLGDMRKRGVTPSSIAVESAPKVKLQTSNASTPDLNEASNQLAAWGI